MITLRTLTPNDWQLFRELRLEALREAPYAFGATLTDWKEADESRWRARLTEVPFNGIAYLDERPAGIASGFPEERETAKLISMWVAPFARGHGVGDALVSAIVAWAREDDFVRLTLDVTEGNEPALALYRRHGFVDDGRTTDAASGRPERILTLKLR